MGTVTGKKKANVNSKPKPISLPIRGLYLKYNAEIVKLFFQADQPSSNDIDIQKIYDRSTKTLGSYVTLDLEHRNDINKIKSKIREYSNDRTRMRPLNIMMLAEPGSGKSHFVKCLAEKLKDKNVSAVIFNMATLQGPDDLIQPIESIRNLKVQDKLPIFFIDEFDSDESKYPILLPLLWDGEVQLGHRELKLGKLVIILAGSSPVISSTIKSVQNMEVEPSIKDNGNKTVDVLSRINGGVIEIPPLDLTLDKRDRRVDKICLTLSLLQRRFGDSLELVPWSLLKFVGETKFRYGVRSIALLIDLIPYPTKLEDRIQINELHLPLMSVNELMKSSLAYHIIPSDKDHDISGIISRWMKISNYNALVRFIEVQEEEDI